MVIKKSNQYKNELKIILENIAKDKVSAMLKFRKELNIHIINIQNMPFKYRPSYYFEEESVRDMIYKGYTIVYEIFDKYIEIQMIFNQNLPVFEVKTK